MGPVRSYWKWALRSDREAWRWWWRQVRRKGYLLSNVVLWTIGTALSLWFKGVQFVKEETVVAVLYTLMPVGVSLVGLAVWAIATQPFLRQQTLEREISKLTVSDKQIARLQSVYEQGERVFSQGRALGDAQNVTVMLDRNSYHIHWNLNNNWWREAIGSDDFRKALTVDERRDLDGAGEWPGSLNIAFLDSHHERGMRMLHAELDVLRQVLKKRRKELKNTLLSGNKELAKS